MLKKKPFGQKQIRQTFPYPMKTNEVAYHPGDDLGSCSAVLFGCEEVLLFPMFPSLDFDKLGKLAAIMRLLVLCITKAMANNLCNLSGHLS